jgi:hypothetical protein
VGRVKQDDLAPFAVADGLLAKMNANPTGATDSERQWMLDHARENLARVLGISWRPPAGSCTAPPWPATSPSSTATPSPW